MTNENKVLIVDHDASFREALKSPLQKLGFRVFETNDCSTGFDLALREHPALITLNADMPNKSALEMIRSLREDERAKSLHIVMLTGLDNVEPLVKMLGTNACDYVAKDPQAVQEVVELAKLRFLNCAETP